MTAQVEALAKTTKEQKKTANTVFIRFAPSAKSLPTRQDVEAYFSEVGPVKKCSLIRSNEAPSTAPPTTTRDGQQKGYGFVKFSCQADAVTAQKRLNNTTINFESRDDDSKGAVRVFVDLATNTNSNSNNNNSAAKDLHTARHEQEVKTPQEEEQILVKRKRTSRVIVRNLSFYATKANIRSVMEAQFGPVVDISLPSLPSDDSAHRGFAFVTFANPSSAQKAVQTTEQPVLIKKRPVAIDFSLSKIQHMRMQMDEAKNKQSNDNKNDKQTVDEPSKDDNEEEQVKIDNNLEENVSINEENMEEEVDDGDDDDDTANQKSQHSLETNEHNEEEKSHQNSLFLRNVPFDATRHQVFTLFQPYGRISGVYLVKDKDTGAGKGTAFVQFQTEGACQRALEASGATPFVSGKTLTNDSGGLLLNGRRILVDQAVHKAVADTLRVERDADGVQKKTFGKDKRNLYLTMEGRVHTTEHSTSNNRDVFENLPESDKLKRQRAYTEKQTKLRSPLFFINPYRLSIRNLAKHVDESQLKELVVLGIQRGLKTLVNREDLIAHWRAGGEMSARDIMHKLAEAEKGDLGGAAVNDVDQAIPNFDKEKKGVKHYVPSVYIDRDFTVKDATTGVVRKGVAPSRGFGFVEFTHHIHALACLRELNNNPFYSAEFVAGGKKVSEMKKKQYRTTIKKKKVDDEFTGEDGRVRIPRLIVEFTVENKAKAKQQAERRAQQAVNVETQKSAIKARGDNNKEEEKKKGKSRGKLQREKKRKMKELGLTEEDTTCLVMKKKKKAEKGDDDHGGTLLITKKQGVLKPLKKVKIDKEDVAFEEMVQSYKATFAGLDHGAAADLRADGGIGRKRWFE